MAQEFIVSVPDYVAKTARAKAEWLHARLRSGYRSDETGLSIELR